MRDRDPRYLAFGVTLALTALLPVMAGFTKVGWELSEILGFAATIACIALCGCPVRPRDSIPPVLLSLARHEALGWTALAAAALHVVLVAAADHTVLEYLKPTAPLYQLAGIVALVVLIALSVSASAGLRRRLWRSHRNFQATHILLGCLLMAALAAHVITTGRYAAGSIRRILFAAAAAGGLAMLLRSRRGAAGGHDAALRRLAFGRHSKRIAAIIAVTLLALGALLPPRTGVALREPLLRRANILPLDFNHAKHTTVNCLICHHNYADGRGFDACIHCHRSARRDLKVAVEARFHDFCLHCHRNPPPASSHHGPVSGCLICHRSGATLR